MTIEYTFFLLTIITEKKTIKYDDRYIDIDTENKIAYDCIIIDIEHREYDII